MKIKAENAARFVSHCELLAHFAEDSRDTIDNPFYAGFKIYEKLRRMENKAHYAAERACNGELSDQQYEKIESSIIAKLHEMLPNAPRGMFINGDPRGYALKIDNDGEVKEQNIYRDFGGYGILAPEF